MRSISQSQAKHATFYITSLAAHTASSISFHVTYAADSICRTTITEIIQHIQDTDTHTYILQKQWERRRWPKILTSPGIASATQKSPLQPHRSVTYRRHDSPSKQKGKKSGSTPCIHKIHLSSTSKTQDFSSYRTA